MVDRNGEAAPGERIQGLEEQKPGVTIARVESELATDVQAENSTVRHPSVEFRAEDGPDVGVEVIHVEVATRPGHWLKSPGQ